MFIDSCINLIRKKLSLFIYNISGIKEKNLYKLKSLHNIYEGKRGFIVCNGPSLRAEDLDLIHKNNEISFASNKIDKIFSKTDWRPTYYTVMDESYQYCLFDTMNQFLLIKSFLE